MDTRPLVLVTGATGKQGGAVARHLLRAGWRVRALTRDPESAVAARLVELGAEVVRGDLDDRASLARAVHDARGVFGVQSFWEHGAMPEIRQGKNLIDAVRGATHDAHFVYSSVGGAERRTGIAHFETKWEIEQHLRASGMAATVLRPVFFMENLLGALESPDGVVRLPLRPSTRLQMIAVDDIGAFAALAFTRRDDFVGQALELAGDELPLPEAAATLARAFGRPLRYEPVPLDEVRLQSFEAASMYEWFERAGYAADIVALRRLHPGLSTFADWAVRQAARLAVAGASAPPPAG